MTAVAPERVLVAGAAGFIGSHLVRHVAALGPEVIALVRPGSPLVRLEGVSGRVTVVPGDLADPAPLSAVLAGLRPDVCLDAAWGDLRGGPDDPGHLASLRHALGLAQMMADAGCRRYIHTGTCFEYALNDGLISEASPLGAHTLYGACKQAAGVAITALGRAVRTMRVAWPRIFYVYGPHEAPDRLVPAVACGLLRREPVETTAGEQVRDYMHVDDVASAIWTVAVSPHEGAVNIATGDHVPVRQVVELIGRLVGRPELLRIGALPDRPEEPPAILGDGTLLRRLGWRPRYTLEEGLSQTVAWWRRRLGEGG